MRQGGLGDGEEPEREREAKQVRGGEGMQAANQLNDRRRRERERGRSNTQYTGRQRES